MILVGGLEHEFYFPFHTWDVILPVDEQKYFSRWAHCTTRIDGDKEEGLAGSW